ncbi:helix-turn-helix transcriptional regulator [Lachnospiraceae bacterium ZAX-1]
METLYTPAEIAEKLRLKKTTVYELIKRGELPSSKVGKQFRISSDDLAKYLKQTAKHTITLGTPESAPLKMNYVQNNSGLVMSGQTQILDTLCSMLESHDMQLPVLRSYMNTYNSLYSIYFKKVHVAVCSLWDADKGYFDLTATRHFIPGIPFQAYHLCKYRLGFYVAENNPKGITEHTDLASNHITIVNRELGCEARILIDTILMNQTAHAKDVLGYQKELISNQAVAAYIAAGNADVGIGDEHTALLYGDIQFIPLKTISADLVFLSENALWPAFSMLVDIIRSADFTNFLSQNKLYDTADSGILLSDSNL